MKERIFENLKKYRMLIFLAITTLLLFFAGLCEPLWIVAAVLTVGFFAFCSVTEILGLVLYFLSFSGIGLHYIVSLIAALVVIAIKYVNELKQGKNKFYVLPFALTCLFVVVFSCVHYKINGAGLEQGLMFIALMFGLYLMFVSKDKIDVHKCFELLGVSICVSTILALGSLIFKGYAYPIYYQEYDLKRYQMLQMHINFLSMTCLFEISYLIYALINKKGNLWFNIAVIAVCVVTGIFTMSKAFMLVCALFALYAFIFMIVKLKKKSIKFVVPLVVVAIAFCVIFRDLIVDIFGRFTKFYKDGNLLDNITTGRYSIWKKYIASITSSVPAMLFGAGFFSERVIDIGPHNTYLHILYRVGFLGIILLGLIVYAYIKDSKSKIKITFSNCLPLLTYIFLSLEEQIFSERFFLFLILTIMLVLVPKSKNEEKNQ